MPSLYTGAVRNIEDRRGDRFVGQGLSERDRIRCPEEEQAPKSKTLIDGRNEGDEPWSALCFFYQTGWEGGVRRVVEPLTAGLSDPANVPEEKEGGCGGS